MAMALNEFRKMLRLRPQFLLWVVGLSIGIIIGTTLAVELTASKSADSQTSAAS